MNNFMVIYRILKNLKDVKYGYETDNNLISAEKLGITEQRFTAIMEMLKSDGYIVTISVNISIYNEVIGSISKVLITPKGMEYLQGNPHMKRVADIAKGVADVIK